MSSYRISDSEKKTYEVCYGVKVTEKDGKFEYSGSTEQISKVSGMVNRNKFLAENKHKVPSYKSKPGSMSSYLLDYSTSANPSSISDSNFHEYQEGVVFSFS